MISTADDRSKHPGAERLQRKRPIKVVYLQYIFWNNTGSGLTLVNRK